MTVEEIKKTIHSMENLKLVLCITIEERMAVNVAIQALQNELERIENKPLTIEQLKNMGGEPYYHVSLQGNENHWCILDEPIAKNPEDYSYGENWLAFKYKPQE